jgi:hypothetical protein
MADCSYWQDRADEYLRQAKSCEESLPSFEARLTALANAYLAAVAGAKALESKKAPSHRRQASK